MYHHHESFCCRALLWCKVCPWASGSIPVVLEVSQKCQTDCFWGFHGGSLLYRWLPISSLTVGMKSGPDFFLLPTWANKSSLTVIFTSASSRKSCCWPLANVWTHVMSWSNLSSVVWIFPRPVIQIWWVTILASRSVKQWLAFWHCKICKKKKKKRWKFKLMKRYVYESYMSVFFFFQSRDDLRSKVNLEKIKIQVKNSL